MKLRWLGPVLPVRVLSHSPLFCLALVELGAAPLHVFHRSLDLSTGVIFLIPVSVLDALV